MSLSLSKLLRLALMTLGLGLAGLGAAQAALFSGAWDPRYGKPFDGNFDADVLGWRGNAVFEVPDACIATGVVASSSCTGMQLVSGQVVFYDYNTDATVETFNYTSSDLSGFSATFDSSGALTSIVSNFFAPRQPTSTFSIINLYAFSLQFVEAGVRMYHTVDFDIHGIDVGPYSPKKCDSNWFLHFTQPYTCGYSGTYSDGSSQPAVVLVTFSRVPEPGSIALLLAAGLAGLLLHFSRSRRRLQR